MTPKVLPVFRFIRSDASGFSISLELARVNLISRHAKQVNYIFAET
jgi:hypothetical protein